MAKLDLSKRTATRTRTVIGTAFEVGSGRQFGDGRKTLTITFPIARHKGEKC
jgi:hypothetical protein